MAPIGLTGNDGGPSASCKKCVKVLRELISGLQENNNDHSTNNNNYTSKHNASDDGLMSRLLLGRTSGTQVDDDNHVPPPLTLLKAIADPPTRQQQRGNDKRIDSHSHNNSNAQHELKVEEVDDGVRLTIPVEATMPDLLRRWTKIVPVIQQQSDQSTFGDDDENDYDESSNIFGSPHHLAQNALATSSNIPADNTTVSNNGNGSNGNSIGANDDPNNMIEPLTIELKCRKCASTGPEGGARAFLMGPQPLSVILCHNRIDSEPEEITEILTHELTHLYDVQTLQLDLQECESLAYSEVRAAKAAECRNWSSSWKSYCVKQKAMNATHNLYPREARSCVNKVFETAFNDNRPFQRNQQYHKPSQQQHHQQQSSSSSSSSGRQRSVFEASSSHR